MISRFHLSTLWDDLRSSLWFRPATMTVVAIFLAGLSIYFDHQTDLGAYFNTGAENARAVLGAIASSMLTVTTLTFSIIMVALVLASQQFSPRILRNFLHDDITQNVLSIFIGNFVYTLIVLTRISQTDIEIFVPGLSLAVSLVFTLISIIAFIYFVHHIAKSIQVTNIVSEVSSITLNLLRDTQEKDNSAPPPPSLDDLLNQGDSWVIPAHETGYLQGINVGDLVQLAQQHEVLLSIERRVGDFVITGTPLVMVRSTAPVSAGLAAAMRGVFDIGPERTFYQDLLFGVRQLADIAVRSISTAINDPTTAVNAMEHLGAILAFSVQRPDPSPYHYDKEGNFRAIITQVIFEDFLNLAFDQIRQYSRGEVTVTVRMLDILKEVASLTPSPQRHALLWNYALAIRRSADTYIVEGLDRAKVNEALEKLAAATGQDALPLSAHERLPAS